MQTIYRIIGTDLHDDYIKDANKDIRNVIEFDQIDRDMLTSVTATWLENSKEYITELVRKFGEMAYIIEIRITHSDRGGPVVHRFSYKDYDLEEVVSGLRIKFNKRQREDNLKEDSVYTPEEEQTYLTKEEHSIAEKLKAMFSLILEYEYGFRKFRFVKKNGVPTYKDEIYKAMSSLDSHNSPRQCIMEAKEKLSVFGIDIVNGDITETNKIINEYYNVARNGGKAMKVFS